MATVTDSNTASAASVKINRRETPDKTAPLAARRHCIFAAIARGNPPRAPPARSQTTIPTAPTTDAFSFRPLMYFAPALTGGAYLRGVGALCNQGRAS